MTEQTNRFPTALELVEAQARGRRERSRAFHHALHTMGEWISGGKPQARR